MHGFGVTQLREHSAELGQILLEIRVIEEVRHRLAHVDAPNEFQVPLGQHLSDLAFRGGELADRRHVHLGGRAGDDIGDQECAAERQVGGDVAQRSALVEDVGQHFHCDRELVLCREGVLGAVLERYPDAIVKSGRADALPTELHLP